MKKTGKKILSTLLAVAIIATSIPCGLGTMVAYAQDNDPIQTSIPTTVTGGSIQITMADGSAVEEGFTTLPKNQIVKLYAKPDKGKKFVKWISTGYNPVGGSLEELSTMENNLEDFSFEEFDGENTTNPLMVRIINPASYTAEFADLENMDAEGEIIATASALQMLSVLPVNEQDRTISLVGENGIKDFQDGIYNYDLNLISTDETNLRLNLAAATGSSVTIDGEALVMTEVTPAGIILKGEKDITVSNGVAVTILVTNPDKSETTYTIMPKISEAVEADPKIILELQTLEGQAQAELAMIIRNAFFNQAQFTISIDELATATESGLKYFTNADGEKLVDGVLSPTETANYNSLFEGVEIFHMEVSNDGRELTFTIVPKSSLDENGLMVARPISINDAGGGELMARFYIKQDGAESLEDMKNQLQVGKDMNTMTDGNRGQLVNDGLNQESTSLVFAKLADMYWLSGYVATNSKKLTMDGRTTIRTSNGAIKVNVYDTIKGNLITDKEESKIAVTNKGKLNYRVFKSGYRFELFTPGYMRYDTPDYLITDKHINLPIINLLAGDINADGFINTEDRAALLSVYNKQAVDGAVNTIPADFNDSGRVDGNDLGLLLSNYGRITTRNDVAPPHRAVTDITGVPTEGVLGTPLTLTGIVAPADAKNQTIVWTLKSGSATIDGNELTATALGDVEVIATITNGLTGSTDYTKEFTISFPHRAVTGITGVTTGGIVGTAVTLAGIVAPEIATNKNIGWSVVSGSAIINENVLTATASGTVKVRATITNGLNESTAYIEEFDIAFTPNIEMGSVGELQEYTIPTGITDATTATVMGGYEMAITETTYDLWYDVRIWAQANGYTFTNAGTEGNSGTVGAAPTAAKLQPVTAVSWRDTIVWLNALSQLKGLDPVYRNTSDQVLKNSNLTVESLIDTSKMTGKNGYRMPTHDEWEMAARWKDGTNWTPGSYASGATAAYTNATASQQVAWYGEGETGTSKLVKGKLPNALGMYDISGNAWEWAFSTTTSKNARGGSYYNVPSWIQVGGKSDNKTATKTEINYGFRIARTK